MTEQDRADGPAEKPVVKMGGLYDGFDAYRTPSEADYENLLTAGLVILDANVLLDLYRYSEQTRADMFAVLKRLGDCLWIPQQVMEEFWRNRENRLQDPRDTKKTAEDLAAYQVDATNRIRAWSNRIGLSSERSQDLTKTLSDAFQEVIVGVNEQADEEAGQFVKNTSKDPVLKGLEPILDGRVGPPVDEVQYQKDMKEAQRRLDAKEPPGYKDARKTGEFATGDYLIWAQTLREAQRRGQDVLMVTEDTKEDWWRLERGEKRGPVPELAQEMRSFAGTRLFMLRPQSLLLHARKILKIEVADESVKDIERVAEEENGGWALETIGQFLARLSFEGQRGQAQVIRLAAVRGGVLERDAVSAIGGLGDGQSLRGFTRPINRITQEFRDRGIISASAIDVLQTDYDQTSGLPEGWATGFKVPEVLIPLILEWQEARYIQTLRELDPKLLDAALEEFHGLGHDVNKQDVIGDTLGNPRWRCSNCGSTISLVGERWISPGGRAQCRGTAAGHE